MRAPALSLVRPSCCRRLAVAGSAQAVGPIPPGGRVPVSFRTSLSTLGSHVLTVRLKGGDLLPGDDASEFPDRGRPGVSRCSWSTASPAPSRSAERPTSSAQPSRPTGDDTPQVRVRVIAPRSLSPQTLAEARVVVLANVDRLTPEQMAAIGVFVEAGGGLLVAPGDRTDPASFNEAGWMAGPARRSERKPG